MGCFWYSNSWCFWKETA